MFSYLLKDFTAQENNNPKAHIPNGMEWFFIIKLFYILTKIQLLSIWFYKIAGN
jgi:hypothetical protein